MLSIVIPFYNDAGCPGPFVNKLKKELEDIEYELILVDDCSTDNTPRELDELKSKNVIVIHNAKNLDYGGAIINGFNIAKGDVIGFTCGDGEIEEKDIVRVYNNMANSVAIKAVRLNRSDGLFRKLSSNFFNLLSKIRFGVNLRDINGYPFFFKKELYKEVSNLRTDWLFNLDFIRKIIDNNHKIDEMVIPHKKRFKGESHMKIKRIIRMIGGYFTYR
jgi:glycosyltransferase involved in cell wall biosynthesis